VRRIVASGLTRSSNGTPFAGTGTALAPGSAIAPGSVSRTLPSSLAAVREARDVVQDVLSGWNAEAIFDDVALVASELVANALRHGLQLEQSYPSAGGIQISLVSTGSHVICAVTDPSERPPVRRPPDPLAGSGRGLQLIESLSLCWGWTLLEKDQNSSASNSPAGKSVWAIFPLGLGRSLRATRVVGAA
jgi:anti-sigma regulatory factor (Ser/Thr protein kinase)